MKDPFRLKATAFLEKIGIELVLGDRVVSSSNGTVNSFDSIDRLFHHEITMNCSIQAVLKSGKEIPCDVFISAFPEGGNATFLPADAKDEKSYAKVDDRFLVHGFNNVFAIGDW